MIHILIVPVADRRCCSPRTLRSSCARSTRSTAGRPARRGTSSVRGCGRRSRPRRWVSSSSCSPCARRSAASPRSTRCGSGARSSRRPSAPARSPTGTSAGSRGRCGCSRPGRSGRSGTRCPTRSSPGVLLPGITFMLLYAWPFLEGRFTKENHEEHHLLDRPRDRPVRTAIGVGALAFYVVLFIAGGNDVLASRFDVSVNLDHQHPAGVALRGAGGGGVLHVPAVQGARRPEPDRGRTGGAARGRAHRAHRGRRLRRRRGASSRPSASTTPSLRRGRVALRRRRRIQPTRRRPPSRDRGSAR